MSGWPDDVDSTVDEYGAEVHPAFGTIGASRVSISPPGAVLFDSDVRHAHTVRVAIRTASRRRDLHHDWIHGNLQDEIVEVELSEAQWASFVSSMNVGDGVPCTIRYRDHAPVPGLSYEPRLAQAMHETREAARAAFDDIRRAMDAYDAVAGGTAKERREALSHLRAQIANAVPNVDFAGKQLIEQTESVVTKARADIEAFVVAKASQLGLSPADIGGPAGMLMPGPDNT